MRLSYPKRPSSDQQPLFSPGPRSLFPGRSRSEQYRLSGEAGIYAYLANPLNPQEDQLWISKNYSLWRSDKVDGEWGAPIEIVSALAGEATLDWDGNVYFTHHYYENDHMIEADIFVIYKK